MNRWQLFSLIVCNCIFVTNFSAEPACCADPETADESASAELMTIHANPLERPALPREFRMRDGDGASLSEVPLAHRPSVIAFFYTRCTNLNKCPAVMSHFTQLRKCIEDAGLSNEVDTLAISYDAYRELPEDLLRYRTSLGKAAQGIRMLVPEANTANDFFKAWAIRGQANHVGVAAHTNELVVLDREGRLYQRNIVILWDTDQVVGVLRKLIEEPQ